MKKLLGIVVLGLLCFSIGFTSETSNFDWIKKQKKTTNTNQLIWKNEFKNLIKENIPTLEIYLGMTKKSETSILYDNFIEVLSGPPNELKFYNNGRYVVATACRHQSCSEKGLLWIDTQRKKIIGLILHYLYKDQAFNKQGEFLIFSKDFKNYKDISSNFNTAVDDWIKDEGFSYPSIRRFIGSDNQINIIKNKKQSSSNAILYIIPAIIILILFFVVKKKPTKTINKQNKEIKTKSKKQDIAYENAMKNSELAGKLNSILLGTIRIQLNLTVDGLDFISKKKDPLKTLPKDNFVYGYLYGFADYSYQTSGKISDEQSWLIGSLAFFSMIFGPDLGAKICMNSEKLLNTNKEFNDGVKSGSNDARDWKNKKGITGLSDYINNL